jgi:hypothetical protein
VQVNLLFAAAVAALMIVSQAAAQNQPERPVSPASGESAATAPAPKEQPKDAAAAKSFEGYFETEMLAGGAVNKFIVPVEFSKLEGYPKATIRWLVDTRRGAGWCNTPSEAGPSAPKDLPIYPKPNFPPSKL